MTESLEVEKPGAPRVSRTLESYTSAFPDADSLALEAHLAVTSTAGMLTRGIEDVIQRAGFDLTRPRYTIVRALYLSPDSGIAQSELAQGLNVSGANITQLIDGLVNEGWVERVVSPADRRVVHARLTTEGKRRAAKLVPAVFEFMQESCAALSAEEQTELSRLLGKMRRALEED